MSKGAKAYERLQRRFQPRMGRDSRSAAYLRERTARLIAWYEKVGLPTEKLKRLNGRDG